MLQTHTYYDITIWHQDPDPELRAWTDIIRGDYWDEPEFIYEEIDQINRTEESWADAVKFVSEYERKHGKVWSTIETRVVETDDSDILF